MATALGGRIILDGAHVRFDVAPAQERDGVVYREWDEDGEVLYVLRYLANDEPSYVVRRMGQFKFIRESRA